MIVTQDTADYLAPVFSRWANESLAADTADLSQLALVSNTPDHDEHTYSFSGFPAAMSRWIAQRQRSDLRFGKITVTNERFSAVIEIEERLLETDRLDLVEPKIRMLGLRGRQHMGKYLAEAFLDGFSTQSYDGVNFFSATHQWGDSGTQDNLTADALTPDSLWEGIENMALFKDDQGEPLGISPTVLLHGPLLRRTVEQIMGKYPTLVTALDSTSALATMQEPNVTPRGLTALETPRIVNRQWGLFDTSLPVKPLIWQWGRNMRVRNDLGELFERGVIKAGIDAITGVGYGEPLLAYGSSYAS